MNETNTTTMSKKLFNFKQRLCKRTTMIFCVNSNKICYLCGSTMHNSSDCPIYA
ncbi:hypothetical protein BCR42DRAFT_404084 [Absidia repens]|uniref:CCHC-type domain-containing protein n=1 Tax=Absidia repens TaxID=90262 RepID=A0A1X2IVQ8_9FUNG|nr:hypothetical protein BCR42DRAFT_404084 [Absidia repens]